MEKKVRIINMLQAKSTLSSLVRALETGSEREIIIARNGRPVARLVPIEAQATGKNFGVARGVFEVPDDIDIQNDEVAALFRGKTGS